MFLSDFGPKFCCVEAFHIFASKLNPKKCSIIAGQFVENLNSVLINLPIILYNTLYAELDTKGLQFSTLALDFGHEAYVHLDNLSKCIRLGLLLQIEDGCCKKFPTLTLIIGQEAF